MTRGVTWYQGKKGEVVCTRSQLHEPQRTQGSRVKGSAEAQSQIAVHKLQSASCSLQVAVRKIAVAVRKSQVMQVDTVASQTLTLRGNECFNFVEVRKGLYTKSTTTFRVIPNESETSYSTFRQVPASTKLTHAGEPLPYGLQQIGT